MPQHLGPQSIGSSRDYQLTLNDPNGESLASVFTGTENFLLQLWTGDDQAPSLSSTTAVSWIDHDIASPTLLLSIPFTLIGELTPGRYFISVLINPDVDNVEVFEPGSTIEFTAVPGVGTAALAYSTFEQIRDRAHWIDTVLPAASSAGSQLSEQRHRAFDWVNDQLMSRDLENHRRDYLRGLDMELLVEWDTNLSTTLDGHNAELRAALDTGGLIVAPTALVEAATWKAIAYTLDAEIGEGPGKSSYQNLAGEYHRMANRSLLQVGDVGVDTDEDAVVDYWIRAAS